MARGGARSGAHTASVVVALQISQVYRRHFGVTVWCGQGFGGTHISPLCTSSTRVSGVCVHIMCVCGKHPAKQQQVSSPLFVGRFFWRGVQRFFVRALLAFLCGACSIIIITRRCIYRICVCVSRCPWGISHRMFCIYIFEAHTASLSLQSARTLYECVYLCIFVYTCTKLNHLTKN